MMDSTSRMSISSTSRSITARPMNANCDFNYDRGVVVVDDQITTNFGVSRFTESSAVTLVRGLRGTKNGLDWNARSLRI